MDKNMTEELKPLPCPFEEWFSRNFPPKDDRYSGLGYEMLRENMRLAWDAALARSPGGNEMTEPFVPKEEGFYWFENPNRWYWFENPNLRRARFIVVYADPNKGIVLAPGEAGKWSIKEALEQGTFHPGPIQPPEEGK